MFAPTYSKVRFTLRFVNLFVEVSQVCAARCKATVCLMHTVQKRLDFDLKILLNFMDYPNWCL